LKTEADSNDVIECSYDDQPAHGSDTNEDHVKKPSSLNTSRLMELLIGNWTFHNMDFL